MMPVIAIVGRPNVGKSTIFNQLTCTKDAIVSNFKGLTRDRHYGHGRRHKTPHILIDTGGLFLEDTYHQLVESQVAAALTEASHIFFVVDAKCGLMPKDFEIAQQLRILDKPVYLLVNKVDGGDHELMSAEFYQLGFHETYGVSAEHNRGLNQLIADVLDDVVVESDDLEKDKSTRVAIIGRPNVGKSTLTNRMLGEDRMVVYNQPGTTVDSVASDMTHFDKHYTLIDTAGVRKKANVTQKIEKFSIVKTLQAIESCHVAILMIDAQIGLGEQDLKLLRYSLDAGKAMIICLNKWDNLAAEKKEDIKKQFARRLRFADFVKIMPISALHGTNVGLLFKAIDEAYLAASKASSTTQLTDWLYQAQTQNPPPLVQGRRIKLRYAHMGGLCPPTIVVHGSQAEKVPPNYQRFLMHFFMRALKLHSTPLKLIFKTTDNPYKDKPNPLNRKQLKKRKRIIKHRIEKQKRKKSKAKA